MELPPAPSGKPPLRKIEGSVRLPEPVAGDVQRHAEEQDQLLLDQPHDHEHHEFSAQKLEEKRFFSNPWGGLPLHRDREREQDRVGDEERALEDDEKEKENDKKGKDEEKKQKRRQHRQRLWMELHCR